MIWKQLDDEDNDDEERDMTQVSLTDKRDNAAKLSQEHSGSLQKSLYNC